MESTWPCLTCAARNAGEAAAVPLSSVVSGPKKREIEGCTRKCVPTCIRGGEGEASALAREAGYQKELYKGLGRNEGHKTFWGDFRVMWDQNGPFRGAPRFGG